MSTLNKMLFCFLGLLIACQKPIEGPKLELGKSPDSLEIFGEGAISTSLYERDIAISPDGGEIVFTLGNYKQTRRSLVSIKKGAKGWGEKQILPFSGQYNDIEPFFSTDGMRLFFASNRPMDKDTTRTDYNIWKVDRKETGWGEAVALDTIINSMKDEFYPSVSENGNLYFTATRPDGIGREDIFMSSFKDKSYQNPVVLDSTINTAVYEFNAYIDPKEELLIFSSFGRKDGLGGGDLYYSRKNADGNWSEAKNMGELVNSEKLDYCPFVDLENGNFYFTSDRDKAVEGKVNTVYELKAEAHQALNGMGNIYRISTKHLNLKN